MLPLHVRISRAAVLAGFFATVLLSGSIKSNLAAEERTVSIENGPRRIEFVLRTDSGLATIVCRSFRDQARDVVIDLSHSPLFQLSLQALGDRDRAMEVHRFPSSEGGRLQLPADTVSLTRRDGHTMELNVEGAPVPDTEQRLDATIVVTLPTGEPQTNGGGGSEWTGSFQLVGEGPLAITALQFPWLRVPRWGASGDDDVLAYPLTGGLLLHDPIAKRRVRRSRAESTFFNYPGYVESQFMAYYDDAASGDRTTGGLYLAAEDREGYLKNLFFVPSPDSEMLDLYVRNFNYAPDPHLSRVDPLAELRRVDLPGKLPYVVRLDLFQGDWMTACDAYRGWLERARPEFLAGGTMAARQDIPTDLKEMDVAIGYAVNGGIDPIEPGGADDAALGEVMGFFTDDGGNPLSVSIAFVGDITADAAEMSIGNDMGVYEVRPGFVSLLQRLDQFGRPGATLSLGLNRDVGNWESDRAQDPAPVLLHGLVTAADGHPLSLASPDGVIKGVTCSGSPTVQAMRLDQFQRSLNRFLHDSRLCVHNTALSGRGTESFLCYAPLYAGDGLAQHHHPIGGGNYCVEAHRKLIATLREQYRAAGLDPLPVSERAHEQLIDSSQIAGRARVAPWDVTFHGTSQWIEEGEPVPIRAYLYHDWAPTSARMPRTSNVVAAYVEAHRAVGREISPTDLLEDAAFLTLLRQRMAAWTVEGNRLGFYVEGPGGSELRTMVDGAPSQMAPGILRNHEFLRELIRFRRRAVLYLVYGRMLRPPSFAPDVTTSDLEVATLDGLTNVRLPSVAASAWRAPDESVAITLVNYTLDEATARLVFNPTDWGFAQDEQLVLDVLEPDGTTSRVMPLSRDGDGKWRSPAIRLTLNRPAELIVVRPAAGG